MREGGREGGREKEREGGREEGVREERGRLVTLTCFLQPQ